MNDQTEVRGIVQALTGKAVLINVAVVGAAYWIPRKFCRVLAGEMVRGCWVVLSVPLWLIEKQERGGASPTPSAPSAGAGIPADMLKRLIYLCHPDKHDSSKASTIATEWLLSLR
jgi:hypothetical protein